MPHTHPHSTKRWTSPSHGTAARRWTQWPRKLTHFGTPTHTVPYHKSHDDLSLAIESYGGFLFCRKHGTYPSVSRHPCLSMFFSMPMFCGNHSSQTSVSHELMQGTSQEGCMCPKGQNEMEPACTWKCHLNLQQKETMSREMSTSMRGTSLRMQNTMKLRSSSVTAAGHETSTPVRKETLETQKTMEIEFCETSKTDSSASQRLIMIHYGHLLQSDFLMEWQVPTITLDNHWTYKYQNATVTAGSQGHKPIRQRDPNEPKTKCKKIRRDAHARSCMLLDGFLAAIITVPQSPRIKSNGKNCYICKAHSKFIRN